MSPWGVVVRRDPKGGYGFEIFTAASRSQETMAHVFHSAAVQLAKKEAGLDAMADDPRLNYDVACRLVGVLRKSGLRVEDAVLRIDARVSQWGKVLAVLLPVLFIAGSILSEGRDGVRPVVWAALLVLVGVLLGGCFRDHWERAPASIPSPWSLLAVIGMSVFGGGMFIFTTFWLQERFGGWGVVLGVGAMFAAMRAVAGVPALARKLGLAVRRSPNTSVPAAPPPPGVPKAE